MYAVTNCHSHHAELDDIRPSHKNILTWNQKRTIVACWLQVTLIFMLLYLYLSVDRTSMKRTQQGNPLNCCRLYHLFSVVVLAHWGTYPLLLSLPPQAWWVNYLTATCCFLYVFFMAFMYQNESKTKHTNWHLRIDDCKFFLFVTETH